MDLELETPDGSSPWVTECHQRRRAFPHRAFSLMINICILKGELAIGHPSLHASPSAIFLLGGQLGFYSLYPHSDNAALVDFSHVRHVESTPEDMSRLQYSSQGRCSKAWWGVQGRPWHRLVSSPAPHEEGEHLISTVLSPVDSIP
jgi:hypothetical protein